jgi:hypothetical protein
VRSVEAGIIRMEMTSWNPRTSVVPHQFLSREAHVEASLYCSCGFVAPAPQLLKHTFDLNKPRTAAL